MGSLLITFLSNFELTKTQNYHGQKYILLWPVRSQTAGRGIKRYEPPGSDRFLIFFPKGFTNKKGNNPRNAWKWMEEKYPAIAKYLKPFEEKGKKRFDQGEYWWELRACDYYDEFENPKIIIPDIALRMQATYDDQKFYLVNKVIGKPISFIL